jgi:hypothetical protein
LGAASFASNMVDSESHCGLAMRLFLSTIAAAGVLLAGPAMADQSLNADLDEICKPLQEMNIEFGASAAPGSPLGAQMQSGLLISAAQYGALWSLLKLTPTPSCSSLY